MIVSVRLETGGRRGKQVTVVSGITHNPQTIDGISKSLKQLCGAGGTIKGKIIEIQGNHVSKVVEWLKSEGYTVKP